MSAVRRHDDPWRRLPWLAPASLVIATLSLMGFLRLLSQMPERPSLPNPIEVGVFEVPARVFAMPAESVAQRSPPEPQVVAPPEPVAQPSPPEPPVVTPPPKELPPEPKVEIKPPPPRPQKRPPPPRAPQQPGPPPAADAPANAPATPEPRPTAPASAAPSPGGGLIGARAIFQPMPEIPETLRQHRLDAVAIVVFHVATDGSATVELREATDDPHLNQVLLEGFKRWRFFPALDHNRPVASTIELRVPIAVR